MELNKIGRKVEVKIPQRFPVREAIEATDVKTLDQYVREIERTSAFYKGCAIGLGIGTAIGTTVIAALVYFLG